MHRAQYQAMSRPLPIVSAADAQSAPAQPAEAAGYAADRAWAELMAWAQAGDRDAYRRLLTEITPYLRALAQRHHRDARGVQDILLTIHSIRHTYDPARPFKPWLVAIGRRRIIDRLRANRRGRLRETELTEEHETFSEPATNIHEAQSDSRLLREAMESLPAGQREAIRLLKIEEKSLKQASAESGVSVAALKVSVHRAVRALRAILERKSEEP
jgi:RNA polymerase sigma-70 factor (ECF subfamily)